MIVLTCGGVQYCGDDYVNPLVAGRDPSLLIELLDISSFDFCSVHRTLAHVFCSLSKREGPSTLSALPMMG